MVRRLKLSDAVEALEKLYGRPRTAERPEDPLLDHLLVGILSRWTDRERAARAARALSDSFLDLNEARVSPLSELVTVLEPHVGKEDSLAAATAARNALQDVFDGTHGLDLEPLRGRDPDDLKKFLKDLPHTMGGPAAVVPQLALGDAHLSLSLAEQRVLSRLAVLPRASTPQRVRVALEKQVKPADRLRFAWAVGSHAGAVCFAKEPACEICPMLPHCPHGDQEMKLRVAERKRLEAKRAADEKKRKELEEKAARIAARHAAAEAKKKAAVDAKAKREADALAKKEALKRQAAEAKKAKADAIAKKRAEAESARKAKPKPKAKKPAKR
jgi:endonuclease III